MIRRIARNAALAAALLAVSAGAAHAAAEPADAQRVQAVIDCLKAGDVPGAVAKLGEGAQVDVLAGQPDLVHVLCDRAFRYDAPKADAAARRTLSSRLVALATAASAAAPDDDRTRWALAEAIVLRERTGPRTGHEAWTQAADLLEKVHAAHPADGLPLSYAVSFLLEGACTDPDATMPLSNRSEALAKKAMESQKDSPTLALTIGATQFWAARTLLPTNKKYARAQLRAALDTLKPFAAKKSPATEIATIFNDALSFGTVNGFQMQERFVMSPKTTLDGTLVFDLPVSSHWSVATVAATDEQPAYDYVNEVDAAGGRLRQVLFRRYAWNQQYTFEGTVPCGGDNVKSIAQGLQALSAARVFAAGAATPAPARKPFCKAFDGFSFEVKGVTAGEKGEPLHLYGFVVRGGDQACYAALVYVYGKDDTESPMVEALVASLREPGR